MIRKSMLPTALLAVLFMFTATSTQAQQGPPAGGGGGRGGGAAGGQGGGAARGAGGRGGGAPATTMIKPGLFMISGIGQGATVVVRVTDDGLVLANTGPLGDANNTALMDQIKTISDKPIKYAVVGDVHQDKSGGTGFLIKNGVQVIGHVNEKEGLKTYTNAAGTPEAPNVTFDKDYSIKLGNKEVAHVYYFGKASTNGDAFVYFPDLKVVTMGDVFQNGMNCDYAQGGSMIEWPKTLEAVMKLDIDTVIPNRGNPGTKADLQPAHDRIAKIDAVAIDLVKKGTPKDMLLAQINAADATLMVNAFLNMNAQQRLDAFYEEVSKAAK
jgi:glyoxylase-like metal-dependent hydrolase (beta-lactamase superfamily II)